MSKVGVVLVNWNGGQFTIPCIQSLLAGTVKPNQIVVVDNASVDESVNKIVSAFGNVKLICNTVNKGFADANNQGIEFLLEQGMDYVLLLNNDTLVAEDCLEQLIWAATLNPEAAGYSGMIFHMDTPGQLWYAGAYRHHLHLGVKHFNDNRLDKFVNNRVVEVDFISGCCMFIPRSALIRHGGFCGKYFAYSEDNEWSWRVRRNKERLLYVPKAVLWHHISASVKKDWGKRGPSPRAWYLMVRNNLWTIRRYAEPFRKKILAVMICVGLGFKVMLLNVFNGNSHIVRSLSKGIWHGLTRALPKEGFHFGIKIP